MERMSFEEAIELRKVSEDIYESLHPPWTWPSSPVIPGGTLLALAARAAYHTLSPTFTLDTLHAQFLAGPSPSIPLQQRVTRLSDGGRFAARMVSVEQKGKVVVSVSLGFVNAAKMGGRAMRHEVGRETEFELGAKGIDLDDLEERGKEGGGGRWMKFQRLGVSYTGSQPQPPNPPPHALTYTSAALISPLLKPSSPPSTSISPLPMSHLQSLALLPLSDYHVLDAPPTLHSLPVGLPAIGDATFTPQPSVFERFTSLNHNVQFVSHGEFDVRRAMYIEVQSDWAGGRRGGMRSRIFQREKDGVGEWRLVAVCGQEGYYFMKEEQAKGKGKL